MTAQADYEVPVLHEVWSPVACHNRDEILHDPAVRRFWGESISRFWEKSLQDVRMSRRRGAGGNG